MYNPAGLAGWEIVAASGLCALGFLTVSTLFAGTLAWMLDRESAPRPAAAPKPAAPPTPSHTAEYATASA
ncbi:MAG: hypothetical protein J0I06_27110 [Planctomycetes bacterium]|nr:hypothetical protein [Planctomycetota bacterium]